MVAVMVDVSESDIVHRPHGKTAVKLKTPMHTKRLNGDYFWKNPKKH